MRGLWSLDGGQLFGVDYVRQSPESGIAKLRASMSVEEFDDGLMVQSVREWCADALLPLATFAVCSDTQVGKRRRRTDDIAEFEVTDLTFPVTTDAQKVADATELKRTKELEAENAKLGSGLVSPSSGRGTVC